MSELTSISSLSGGKSSSYMAVHYPADHYVFAVVLINHKPSQPKDKGLSRECQKRIPHFIASAEADLTLSNMLKLEQEIGKKIDWVASEFTFDDFIYKQTDLPGYRTFQPTLPNKRMRFCTENLKIYPIFWHCYLNYFTSPESPIFMNVGFRWDELNRVNAWTCENDKFRFPIACSLEGQNRWRYSEVNWRVTHFPLFHDRVNKERVDQFWSRKGWEFPEVSNCRYCFHHRDIQQQRQAELEPENLKWWLEKEQETGRTFGDRSLEKILDQPLLDVYAPASCLCTD